MIGARTPVLVGAATITQRLDDPLRGVEAVELMRRAVVAAAEDAGSTGLLQRIGLILVPKGIWSYGDPGRLVAAPFGVSPHTVLAEVGILQQTLLSAAVQAVAEGATDVAVVCGGEAKHRDLRAMIAGTEVATTSDEGSSDELWEPAADILSRAEIERDLAIPAHQYAMIESALRHARGDDDDRQRDRLGRLWSAFGRVAESRPDAWDPTAPSAEQITTPGPGNRMVATPYTKHLCSQWNVDQAAALIVVSVAEAERLGLERDRWIFPTAAAESNAMTVLPARAELHRSPAVDAMARAALGHVGLSIDRIDHLDLYSCFPAAVQVQAIELGIDVDRPLTVTGGMTFGGGPLNNYVLQATATMVERLRETPGSTGMVTSVSGMLTKTGVGLWSSAAPTVPFAAIDVSDAATAATALRPFDPDATGMATIVGSTVVHDGGLPARAVVVAEQADGRRTVAVARDRDLAVAMTTGDWCGRSVVVRSPGSFEPA